MTQPSTNTTTQQSNPPQTEGSLPSVSETSAPTQPSKVTGSLPSAIEVNPSPPDSNVYWDNSDSGMPNIDPTDVVGKQLVEQYSPEDDIYNNDTTKLVGQIEAFSNGQDSSATATQPSEPDNFIDTAIDWGKGAIEGPYEGLLTAPANLTNWAMREAVKSITGKYPNDPSTLTTQQNDLVKKYPWLYSTSQNVEAPTWLDPQTIGGNLVKNVSQFASGYAGIGALGKVTQAGEILNGAEGMSPLAQKALALLKAGAQAKATDFLSFDAHTGNLANMVADIAGKNHPLIADAAKYLSVNANDNEAEGRLKNVLASTIGEALSAPVFHALSALGHATKVGKTLASSAERIVKNTAAWKALEEGYNGVVTHSQEFKNALEDAKTKLDTDTALDNLFIPTVSQNKGEGDNTGAKVHADVSVEHNEDGSASVHVEGYHETAEDKAPEVHILNGDTKTEEAAEKVTQAFQDLQESRLGDKKEALKHFLKAQAQQSQRTFDKKAFKESLEEKLKRGQPIDIGEELTQAMGGKELENIDHFLNTWKEVTEATTSSVKRYVSNKSQLNRVMSILASDLGNALDSHATSGFQKLLSDSVNAVTAIEEAAMQRLGLSLLEKHVLAPELGKLNLAYRDALVAKDKAAQKALAAEIRKKFPLFKQAQTLQKMILSEAGRLLQTGKMETTDEDAIAFGKALEKARKDLPLLTDEDLLSDKALEMMGHGAYDLANQARWGDAGAASKFGKHFMQWAHAVKLSGSYGLGVAQEVFYNGILASLSTVKNIAFSSAAIKAYETSSEAIGATGQAMVTGDTEGLYRVRDEVQGLIRYCTEGLSAGMTVLKTGSKADLDWTTRHPRIISSEGIRQHFGKSLGDLMGHPGNMADRIIDLTGHVINFPTTNMIGGIDAAFRVANQRAMIYTELKAIGRYKGMSDLDAMQFANENIDSVTHDLIMARGNNFSDRTPLSNTIRVSTDQLKDMDKKLQLETAKPLLQIPLKGSGYSDRWLFKTLDKVNDLGGLLGLPGKWELPFVKVFANAVQYGADNTPILSLLSPYNWKATKGEMGLRAQNAAIGKQLLGLTLAAGGVGAANAGWLQPTSGSKLASKMDYQLSNESLYSVKLPSGGHNAVTLNFNRFSPLADGFFLPGQLWQLGNQVRDGKIDVNAASYSAIATAAEAFSSNRFLRGVNVSMDSILNPNYNTPDNFMRSLYASAAPGTRPLDNITAWTDPDMRDFSDYKSFILSKIPFLSNKVSPQYDLFGNTRPKEDYLGNTKDWAANLIRLVTPIGIKYVTNDRLAKEIERFGRNGQTLSPPGKNMQIQGVLVPLTQYKNKDGESLWDAYNKALSTYQVPLDASVQKHLIDGTPLKYGTIRGGLDDLINSQGYKIAKDNEISHVAGVRQQVYGSRWTAIQGFYQNGKAQIKRQMFGDGSKAWQGQETYFRDYKNANGKSLQQVLMEVKAAQDAAQ